MAQEYGAAQPIYDVFKNTANKVRNVLGTADQKTETPKKTDSTYHDQMVKAANQSFKDQTAKPAPAAKRVTNQKPTATKKAPAKSTARKKLATKNY